MLSGYNNIDFTTLADPVEFGKYWGPEYIKMMSQFTPDILLNIIIFVDGCCLEEICTMLRDNCPRGYQFIHSRHDDLLRPVVNRIASSINSDSILMNNPLIHVLALIIGNSSLPAKEFYILALNNHQYIRSQYTKWHNHINNTATEPYNFIYDCFIYDLEGKALLLKLESTHAMRQEAQDCFFRALFDGVQQTHLPLAVRRSHLIQDAIHLLKDLPRYQLRRQLRVTFVGEEGVDQGGPKKEFFHLIFKELFQDANLFTLCEDSNYYWFTSHSRSVGSDKCYLLGVLLGLAVYNSVLIEVPLLKVFFKKILSKECNFSDLEQLNPTFANSLMIIRNCGNEEEFEASFPDLTFAVDIEKALMVELIPNGSNIKVTYERRHEFCHLYMDLILNKLVSNQLEALQRGFMTVVGDSILMNFKAEEVETLLCGIPDLDFTNWQLNCKYEGYNESSLVVQWFWSFLQASDLKTQSKVLFFITGSSRAPVGGLSTVPLTILRNGDRQDMLPTAHTCFNYLLLPEYTDKDIFTRLLMLALEHCHGFGLA